jgi:hypothetical protein
MERRPLFVGRIILAFFIATLIFISGFLASYMITYYKYKSVSLDQENIRYNLLSLQLEKELVSSSCELFDLSGISEELSNMGSIIGLLEERLGKRDSRVLDQKKYYSLLEAQHFLIVKDYNEHCNNSVPVILFFYSNQRDFLDEAERKGYILSSLKAQNPEVMIYSFDYDLNTKIISLLMKKYKISEPNVVVIVNKDLKSEDFANLDELEEAVFGNKSSDSGVIVLN